MIHDSDLDNQTYAEVASFPRTLPYSPCVKVPETEYTSVEFLGRDTDIDEDIDSD